jgi:hypothetical protein
MAKYGPMDTSWDNIRRLLGGQMHRFRTNFVRESEGVWRCSESTTLLLPNGHKIEVAPGTVLTRGTSFMGVELARLLDEAHGEDAGRPK